MEFDFPISITLLSISSTKLFCPRSFPNKFMFALGLLASNSNVPSMAFSLDWHLQSHFHHNEIQIVSL